MKKKTTTRRTTKKKSSKNAKNTVTLHGIYPEGSQYNGCFASFVQIVNNKVADTIVMRFGSFPDIGGNEIESLSEKGVPIKPLIKVEIPLKIAKKIPDLMRQVIDDTENTET